MKIERLEGWRGPIIRTNFIPPKGFTALNFCGMLFIRKDYYIKRINEKTLNHESIHSEQMKEMGYIFFYILYVIEWFIKMILLFSSDKAYAALASEQEAYKNDKDFTYLENRKRWKWLKKVFSLNYKYRPKYNR